MLNRFAKLLLLGSLAAMGTNGRIAAGLSMD